MRSLLLGLLVSVATTAVAQTMNFSGVDLRSGNPAAGGGSGCLTLPFGCTLCGTSDGGVVISGPIIASLPAPVSSPVIYAQSVDAGQLAATTLFSPSIDAGQIAAATIYSVSVDAGQVMAGTMFATSIDAGSIDVATSMIFGNGGDAGPITHVIDISPATVNDGTIIDGGLNMSIHCNVPNGQHPSCTDISGTLTFQPASQMAFQPGTDTKLAHITFGTPYASQPNIVTNLNGGLVDGGSFNGGIFPATVQAENASTTGFDLNLLNMSQVAAASGGVLVIGTAEFFNLTYLVVQ